jgi:hypothetical protein
MGDMALQAAAGGLRTATVAALSRLVAWQLKMEDVRQLLTPEDIQVRHTSCCCCGPLRACKCCSNGICVHRFPEAGGCTQHLVYVGHARSGLG